MILFFNSLGFIYWYRHSAQDHKAPSFVTGIRHDSSQRTMLEISEASKHLSFDCIRSLSIERNFLFFYPEW